MHNFPFQCGTNGDNPLGSVVELHEVREGDVALLFTDGYHDNVYDSGMNHCIEEYMEGGIVTSLSHAADCAARKAYWLGKNQNFKSPWIADMQRAYEAGEELPNPVPPNFKFVGGKEDDITVTVA